MGKLLLLKMIRDMRKSLSAWVLCVVIVAVGFDGYCVLQLCYENLSLSKERFIAESGFCDGFTENEDAPLTQAAVLEQIDGVEEAQGRLVRDVQVFGYEQEVELHLVSWASGEMNRPLLSAGTMPEEGRLQMVVGEGMAAARNIRPGDTLEILSGGKRVPMEVTGIGLTPENIYMVRDANELYPSPASYDAAFTSYQTAARLAGKQGKANSFLIRLEPGARWEDVEEPVKRAMKPYGLHTAYKKEDQTGVTMVGEEITQLERMAAVVPFLFLLVAGVVMYITLSRMVEQQRTQIGVMTAMGISGNAVRLHYMAYGGAVGLAGGLSGGILGYLQAGPMADFYRMYFRLPDVTTPLPAGYLVWGTVAATAFCGGTAFATSFSLGKMNPAQALRPAAPGAARSSFLEKIPGFTGLLTVPGLMAVRGLARNRRRTVMSLAGMAVAFMITATLVSMNTMFDLFIFDFWEKTQRQDIMVFFDRPVKSLDALDAVRHPQIWAAEGVLDFPVTLSGPKGTMDSAVQAVKLDSGLIRLYQEDGRRAAVEERGIVISRHMAAMMGVEKGDLVEVKVSYPKERISRVKVTGVIAQYMGASAYMSYSQAARVSGYRDVFNGVYIKAPPRILEALKEQLQDAEAVSTIQSRQQRVDQYRAVTGSMGGVMASMSLMGAAISFAVVYTSCLIRFEELKSEISTLMILGLKGSECLEVLSTGQWILAAGAVFMGIPMAMWASSLISATMASDMYTLPNFLSPTALAQSVALTGAAVYLGTRMMLRRLKKMIPAEILRERE